MVVFQELAVGEVVGPACGPLLADDDAAAAARDLNVTDDAALLEALGQPVYVFEGDAHNLKITTPDDLLVAAAYLGLRSED